MMKQFYFKGLFSLLLLLVRGVSVAWGDTFSFVQTSTSAGTLTGAPTGVTATFANTYANNKDQITKGNTMTLTIKNLGESRIITGITLSLHNNSSTGSGSATAKIGTTTIGTLSSITGLGNSSYTDLDMTVTPTAATGDLVIVVSCSANSVYCNKFTITYEEDDGTTATTTTLNETEWTFNLAESTAAKALTATVTNRDTGDEIDGATVTWESSDDEVATVDASGNVTPVAEGTATITAKYAGVTETWSASQATCAVTVENYYSTIDLTSIESLSFSGFSSLPLSTSTYSDAGTLDITGNDSNKYRWDANKLKRNSANIQMKSSDGAYLKYPSVTSTYGYIVNVKYTSGGSGKPSINDGETTKTLENNTDVLVSKTSAPLNILNNSSTSLS